MTDWAEIGKSIVPGESVVGEAKRILSTVSAGNEQQIQARVEQLLGKHFLGPETARAMLKTQDIGVVAPLPKNIVEVLNMQSPVHEQGVLVREGHILAYVPENVSFEMLHVAVGKKLYSDWFVREGNPIADLTLSEVNQTGHWALIPNRFPPGTESKLLTWSLQGLEREYPQYRQADVISFTTALLLNEFKNGEDARWYPELGGWCKDPREGISQHPERIYGAHRDSPSALSVGCFSALLGLRIDRQNKSDFSRSSTLGCAALWDFLPSH